MKHRVKIEYEGTAYPLVVVILVMGMLAGASAEPLLTFLRGMVR